ncbi:hypothetical protein DTO195F2_5685 [Paecilomyces variotii]|nr:hypothetical protein DTO195F2_5685 [Paecilomyces variotii]KAJ9305821.1 hypothetical protein DTO217A2_4734 [Paecilomyces variotii]KAJ9351399.1 hypothetical protein DTO027B9_6436 [Paecilomyces variotii]KAJ9369846.1 hypothetical protein DTO282E5_5521 [Paecilomyces variotii]KAJ9399962.1 hypothetical protein DTO282F9_3032 [Paecilomyces variotii]
MVQTRRSSRKVTKDKGEQENTAHDKEAHEQDRNGSSAASAHPSTHDAGVSATGNDSTAAMSKQGALKSPQKKIKWRGAPNDDDLTAYHPEQVDWSIDNLPEIIYVLRPTAKHAKSRAEVTKTTYEIFGQVVNDFPVLPRQISSRVEGWRCEAWSRMDRRITPEDIVARVNPKYQVTASDIEMRRYRFRQGFNLGAWGSGSSIAAAARILQKHGIDPKLNSTRGSTPGLIRPELGEAGGRIPLANPFPNYDTVNPRRSRQRFPLGYLPTPSPAPNEPIAPPIKPKEEDETAHSTKAESENDVVFDSKSESTPPSLTKESLSPVQEIYNNFPSYPDPEEYELAHHRGPPARAFQKETEEKHMTMTLEEYLQHNNLTYEQYLERENEPRARKRRSPMLSNGDVCMSLSKRLRHSIEGPLKSSDSEMDETASEILGKFKSDP